MNRKTIIKNLGLLSIVVLFSCYQKVTYLSPKGYNLVKPEKVILKDALLEISGLALHNGVADTFFAINDEEGKLYYFTKNNRLPGYAKFGKSGDYEDLVISGGKFIILKSNGKLYTFPYSLYQSKIIDSATKEISVFSKGEYEGLAADTTGRLYVMCKHCKEDEDQTEHTTIYTFTRDSIRDTYTPDSNIWLNVKEITRLSGKKNVRFAPSALAQHPKTKQWFILSSVNKLLVVTDAQFNVKEAYPLKPSLFRQPEGIAFDNDGNLYITNEGKDENADLLIFKYQN
ncbi:MAG: SdiA-regulated domain-containing protein [Filimonas sp.]|nr:SdiA-regulated domain-containing protein [Filimonas sp.]